jgi:hypothetical protein
VPAVSGIDMARSTARCDVLMKPDGEIRWIHRRDMQPIPCCRLGIVALRRRHGMITIRTLALSALAIFSAACLAQVTPEDPSKHTGTTGQGAKMTGDPNWDSLDTNNDGYLTKDELQGSPGLVHNFDKIDTDHDGKVSMSEWKAYGSKSKTNQQ